MARSWILVAALLAAACGKSDSEAAASVISAWERAGLAPSKFVEVDGNAFGGGKCRGGAVSGIAATLCEYPDAEAARRAEKTGVAQISDATGLALAQGKLLLVVADRERKDPSGKSINQIARAFRDR
jgi:hypothetical protein